MSDAVDEIAAERKWPYTWLNEGPRQFFPHGDDPEAVTVFDQPGLLVKAASPRVLIAMKMLAGRPQDVRDMAVLIKLTPDLRTAEALYHLVRRLLPGKGGSDARLAPTAEEVLREAGLL